jgi:hypothetical protein
MIFGGLSAFWTISMLSIAAAVVTALHVLRSRPVRREVPSLLFWAASTAADRPRQLWQRLRQLASWLLFLGLSCLILLATSRWVIDAADARNVIVVLAADQGMHAPTAAGGGSVFERAQAETETLLRGLGLADRAAVVVADPQPRLLADFDVPPSGTLRRTATLAPSLEPGDLEQAVRFAHALDDNAPNHELIVIADRPVRPTALGATADPERVQSIVIPPATTNGSIQGAWFEPDATDPTRGRTVVQLAWSGDRPVELTLEAKNAEEQPIFSKTVRIGARSSLTVRSEMLPASGESFTLALREPTGNPADNFCTLRLPLRRAITVSSPEALPRALLLALEAIPARTTRTPDQEATLRAALVAAGASATDADIVVVADNNDNNEPRDLRLVESPWTRGLAFDDARAASNDGFVARFDPAGDEPLLAVDGQPVMFLRTSASGRQQLWLSTTLLSGERAAATEPAFALLIARLGRTLAGWSEPSATITAARTVEDPLWTEAMRATHRLTIAPGPHWRDAAAAPTETATDAERASAFGAVRWLLLGGLALILLESWLSRHARTT